MTVTLSQEQLDAVNAIDEAVKKLDRDAFRSASKHLKMVTADISCDQSKNAIRVLAVMGLVGDIENAPAVFAYLKERIDNK
jgi:hypothetical protein